MEKFKDLENKMDKKEFKEMLKNTWAVLVYKDETRKDNYYTYHVESLEQTEMWEQIAMGNRGTTGYCVCSFARSAEEALEIANILEKQTAKKMVKDEA